MPIKDSEDPSRANLRKDIDDPSAVKEITAMAEPMRAKLLRDTVDAMWASPKTESVEPKRATRTMPEPKRATVLSDSVLPI